jgi:ABC transporter substrate binding protein
MSNLEAHNEVVSRAEGIQVRGSCAAEFRSGACYRTVPIVFAAVSDPVGAGVVDTLARPGGNVTGFMNFEYNLSGKWVELLKQIAPRVTRAAVLRNPAIPARIGQFSAIPALLWLTWRRNADGARDDNHLSFRDWAAGEFKTGTDSVKGANATVEILLPIAAVAVGMTVLGLLFRIMANGGA